MVSEVKTFHRERFLNSKKPTIMQIENGNLKTVQSLSLFTAICCILFQMFYTFLPTFKQTLSLECKDLFLEDAIAKFKESFTWIELTNN